VTPFGEKGHTGGLRKEGVKKKGVEAPERESRRNCPLGKRKKDSKDRTRAKGSHNLGVEVLGKRGTAGRKGGGRGGKSQRRAIDRGEAQDRGEDALPCWVKKKKKNPKLTDDAPLTRGKKAVEKEAWSKRTCPRKSSTLESSWGKRKAFPTGKSPWTRQGASGGAVKKSPKNTRQGRCNEGLCSQGKKGGSLKKTTAPLQKLPIFRKAASQGGQWTKEAL